MPAMPTCLSRTDKLGGNKGIQRIRCKFGQASKQDRFSYDLSCSEQVELLGQ
jgi:hypothetical protein